MLGSATLTIDRSRMTMNCETQHTASTSCLREALGASMGFCSVVPMVALPWGRGRLVVAALGRLDEFAPPSHEVPRPPLGSHARSRHKPPPRVLVQGMLVVEHLGPPVGALER